MSVVSVQEAARRLGASPAWIRQKAVDGELVAYRLGREWAVDERGLARLRRRPEGRPLSPRSCWLMLFAISGDDSRLLAPSRVDRQRSRDRARRLIAQGFSGADVRSRAEVRRFRGSPDQVAALLQDNRVVRSGISAAAEVGSSLLDSAREFEGYVRDADLGALIREVRLEDAPLGEHGRILLRVPRSDWPFPKGLRVAPRGVVAADLAESHDPRSRDGADELLGLA
jgi:excisionase family DNA binding protein